MDKIAKVLNSVLPNSLLRIEMSTAAYLLSGAKACGVILAVWSVIDFIMIVRTK